jgi:hypothetical protein
LGFFLTLKKPSFRVKPSVTQLPTTSHVVRWFLPSLQVLQASTEVPIDPEEEPIYEEDLEVPEAVIEENSSPAVSSAILSRLLKSAIFWHARLGHIGLPLLKKTARITKGLSNFEGIKESEFYCKQCAVNKAVRRFRPSIVKDLFIALAVIESDLFIIKPTPYNRAKYVLVLVKRKTRYR